ncbi:MAG: hypothetical protein A3C43_03775 [Candidatus Schekmanbacteria bacterium RIFCSPHIGHO2_02_FULL_38_11]|nr:MAG: hypothetical protein A3C43_03775 [Candidatus Schekmanbacteria bacterium RIFCSPHIGHO2_02_FULL_38_11]
MRGESKAIPLFSPFTCLPAGREKGDIGGFEIATLPEPVPSNIEGVARNDKKGFSDRLLYIFLSFPWENKLPVRTPE